MNDFLFTPALSLQDSIVLLVCSSLLLLSIALGWRLYRQIRTNRWLKFRISEQNHRIRNLTNKKDLLYEAQQLAKLGAWEYDVRKNIVRWSDALSHILGRDQNFYPGSLKELLSEYSPKQDMEFVQWMLRFVLIGGDPRPFEMRMQRSDGDVSHLLSTAKAYFDENGTPVRVIGTSQDITDLKLAEQALLESELAHEKERQELQNRLKQAEKLEAIGQLAGGIAHDMNNILQGIFLSLTITKNDPDLKESVRKQIQSAIRFGERGKELVNQILAFSRKGDAGPQRSFDAVATVKESLGLIRATRPRSVELVTDIPDASLTMTGNPGQVHQIIINLSSNALYEMKNTGGRLHLKADQEYVSESLAQKLNLIPGNYFRLTVSDTGPGIPESDLSRIFDPFFTTKPMGEGTGLGLAVVYGIVTAHKGSIHVSSNIGAGTSFDIYLPLSETGFQSEATEQLHSLDSTTRFRKILVIDDEPELAELQAQALLEHGFEVDWLSDSIKALERLRLVPNKYDVVLSDNNMPNFTGAEICHEIRKAGSQVPFFLLTGYYDEKDEGFFQRAQITEVFVKPLGLSELIQRINNAAPPSTPNRSGLQSDATLQL